MGIDRRTWVHARPGGQQVTRNRDSLLAENQALRQEVAFLRQQLAQLRQRGPGPSITTGATPGITPELVRHWGNALAHHPRWGEIRIGAASGSAGRVPGSGLEGLIEQLLARGPGAHGGLEDQLDQRSPGLGSELSWALRGPRSKAKLAVKAAFALHRADAPAWLSAEPLRVVDHLLTAIERLEAAARQQRAHPPEPAVERQRSEALHALGLPVDASAETVKAAHRRLVKQHHPDLGGDAEAFRRINAAYQLLIA